MSDIFSGYPIRFFIAELAKIAEVLPLVLFDKMCRESR
jgi:hypothetical protein